MRAQQPPLPWARSPRKQAAPTRAVRLLWAGEWRLEYVEVRHSASKLSRRALCESGRTRPADCGSVDTRWPALRRRHLGHQAARTADARRAHYLGQGVRETSLPRPGDLLTSQ